VAKVKGFCGKSVVVRAENAGAWVGVLKAKNGNEVTLNNGRRLWYWKGANSLSQLAVDGVACPTECKFPASVKEIIIMGVIEIIPMTDEAVKSINAVSVWTV
jgi:hypothetical protein